MISDSVRKDSCLFPCEPPPVNSRKRDRFGGVIDGEIPDCRQSGFYHGEMPCHTAICGLENWPEEILEEYRGPDHHRFYSTPFVSEQTLVYEELEGFQLVGSGELAVVEEEEEISEELSFSESFPDPRLQQEITAWLFERYGRVMILMKMAELMRDSLQLVEKDAQAIQTAKPRKVRKELRQDKREYRSELRRRVNAQKPLNALRQEIQRIQNEQFEPKYFGPIILSTRLPKPEDPWPDPDIESQFLAAYGERLINMPVELSPK